jgi:hypothetical protein
VAERPKRTPVVIGVNWYAEFDHPEKGSSGDYFIAKAGPKKLTTVRGGHCVCLEPGGEPDKVAEGHVAWVDSYADDDFQLRAKYTLV